MIKISEPNRGFYFIARCFSLARNKIDRVMQKLNYLAYYHRFSYIGQGVTLGDDITIIKPENIRIGEETFIGANCRLNAVDEITIGRNCGIAAGCTFMTWNHRIHNRSLKLRETGRRYGPIKIGDGVWMGYDVIVLPGVTVGDGAVAGAGAVITRDVESFEIVAGVPAKPIGRRTEQGPEMYD